VDEEGNEGPQSDADQTTTEQEPPPDDSFDGTGKPTDDDFDSADSYLSDAMLSITTYWTGWWPLLNVVIEHEIQYSNTSLVVDTHYKKNLLGITEYSECSVEGDASVLGAKGEAEDWIAWNIDTIISPILLIGITVAAATLEWAAKCNPNPIILISAAFALTTQALWAIAMPAILASHMVNIGEWQRTDAGRYLLDIGLMWLTAAIGFGIINAFGNAGMSIGVLESIAQAVPLLTPLAKVLAFALWANIVILGIGIALIIIARIWLDG